MRAETLARLAADTMALLERDGLAAFDRFARMGSRPIRFSAEVPYRGGNVIALWATAQLRGYGSPYWMTFKQVKDAPRHQWADVEVPPHVRKGETATLVTYVDTMRIKDDGAGAAGDDDAEGGRRRFLKAYSVFNAEQVEGLAPRYLRAFRSPDGWQPLEQAERFVHGAGVPVREGTGHACYWPAFDRIDMPDRRAFADAEGWYATAFHELVHATGARRRLAREPIASGSAAFGSDGYAREELVAELGSALLCADLGLSKAPREDHALYLAGWLTKLRKDPLELWSAARAAEAAAEWLLERDAEARQAAA